MTLKDAEIGTEYTVKEIRGVDEELNSFLFTLGCYSGENVTVISKHRKNCVIAIKDGRYSIDDQLADAISVY